MYNIIPFLRRHICFCSLTPPASKMKHEASWNCYFSFFLNKTFRANTTSNGICNQQVLNFIAFLGGGGGSHTTIIFMKINKYILFVLYHSNVRQVFSSKKINKFVVETCWLIKAFHEMVLSMLTSTVHADAYPDFILFISMKSENFVFSQKDAFPQKDKFCYFFLGFFTLNKNDFRLYFR